HKSRRDVLNAIKELPSLKDLLSTHEGHFDHELDLEVTVYGRNYSGKKVGPYVRLFSYEPGEAVVSEGEWGGNTFYVVVAGYVDVFVRTPDEQQIKVAELRAGTQFGEMSVLAGTTRSATIKAPAGAAAQVLEIQRPALRLLRKLPAFGENLDRSYREHGRDAIVEDLKSEFSLTPEMSVELKRSGTFRVYSKNHVLLREGAAMDRIFLMKRGWLRRVCEGQGVEDFLGKGYSFGVEGIMKPGAWPYSVTLMGRSELMEIPIASLRKLVSLRETLARELAQFAPPALGSRVSSKLKVRTKELSAQQSLIEAGLVDATNLLVMDMDLCVRCGNCSMACHQIHGQSRLTRRGIHVTRLDAPRASAIQSVLAPAVCMHCQDPECLTGCPTGAIGRFGAGQIDIDSKTCIGCGDCASQCPYNAIALISRKSKPADKRPGFAIQLRDFLRLTAEPLPPAVDSTDDLVAVKCNLCSDRTTLNPPGSKTPAYSCEENCPTGALARINPHEYFTEVGAIEGLMMLDQAHATGRNIHKSDPPKRAMHIGGLLLTVLLGAVAILGLQEFGMGDRILGFLNMRWLTGLVGLIGIAGVMTYPARRQVYTRRKGPLRYWLLAHSYLGVIAGLMILLHGGADSGGLLTTALMISFDVVIATGLFGIGCYIMVPRLLTKIEGSPLLIDDLKQRRTELQEKLAEIGSSPCEPLRTIVRKKVIRRFVSFGYLMRQYVRRENLDDLLESAKAKFASEKESLKDKKDRKALDQAIEAAATLRRIDALIYLHRLLKVWLPPHVVSTSLMLALMIVHIVQVVYYASR
ncbi:MAG TPA: cyclic nucleotide-binding domain-containing protein, partial [Blastocatellia bacterium]|nr:cyclic nucleotide-binding domain-containing protein [Blastocatellia bacterium]